MNYEQLIHRLKSLSNPDVVKGMARYGINPVNAFGISIPKLRELARQTGKNHETALQLWSSSFHEARILAGMIDEPAKVTRLQMDCWAADFDSWDVCDQCIMNLFEKLPWCWAKAIEWSSQQEEFVKRAGFVLMARLAVSDKNASDSVYYPFFEIMIRESGDERNYVKKAVNWALRQIGKRDFELNRLAVATAYTIKSLPGSTPRWIASDALRELESSAVQQRLGRS